MHETKSRRRNLVISAAIICIGAFLTIAIVASRQTIIDYVRSIQYQPSAAIKTLRDRLDLTSRGELYFNASQPLIQPASAFNHSCGQTKETNSPIIGCYSNDEIYIFDVTNPKLNGIEETTAAHELLQAAYQRLSTADKATLDRQLSAAYEAHKTPELEERMNYYRTSEPGEEMNELHSILGTEVADLGPALEAHYAMYFKNRGALLKFHDQYSSVFDSVSGKMKSLAAEINRRTTKLNQRIDRYNQNAKQFASDTAAFKQRNDSGGFSSYSEFYTEQNALLGRQATLSDERRAMLAEITAINTLRDSYNTLVDEYNQLSTSLNSSLTPVNALE